MKHSSYSPVALLLSMAIGSVAIISCNNESSADKKEDTTAIATVSSADTMNHAGMHDTAVIAPLASHAEAALSGTYPDTTVSGLVKFDAGADGKVKMELEITVPLKANKSVAVHLHEHGDCGDTGKMAHGHWNPTNAQHGKWGEGSFHLGDIGNVKLDSKGKGKITLDTNLWTLGGPAATNIIGRAVIIHGGVDDFKTQPTGNAGTRIGCGVIK